MRRKLFIMAMSKIIGISNILLSVDVIICLNDNSKINY